MPINKINKKKNGKQGYRVRVNYSDVFGNAKQIEKTVYGIEEAKMVEMQLLKQVQEKEVAGNSLTLLDLYFLYVDKKQYEVRQTTTAKTKQLCEKHILPYFDNAKISKLDVRNLQE